VPLTPNPSSSRILPKRFQLKFVTFFPGNVKGMTSSLVHQEAVNESKDQKPGRTKIGSVPGINTSMNGSRRQQQWLSLGPGPLDASHLEILARIHIVAGSKNCLTETRVDMSRHNSHCKRRGKWLLFKTMRVRNGNLARGRQSSCFELIRNLAPGRVELEP
jgi:hypothetical protein